MKSVGEGEETPDTDYGSICRALESLIENVPHKEANLANAAALLFGCLKGVNWAGFYWLQGETLVLGSFQGRPACIEIPVGRGVCGTAVERRETLVVEDVHRFAGHIACDVTSNSEIVIPIRVKGEIVGVLDIDSPTVGRFTETDRKGLERFVEILEKMLEQ
ncbi:MAG: GAF domain-containing protein [Ruminococcaceae bacterium]|nr:GAF domain-containing protein [Oscillospiraceae bacterium]